MLKHAKNAKMLKNAKSKQITKTKKIYNFEQKIDWEIIFQSKKINI